MLFWGFLEQCEFIFIARHNNERDDKKRGSRIDVSGNSTMTGILFERGRAINEAVQNIGPLLTFKVYGFNNYICRLIG